MLCILEHIEHYLEGEIEGLKMTLKIFQLNKLGCLHRLAINKGTGRNHSK